MTLLSLLLACTFCGDNPTPQPAQSSSGPEQARAAWVKLVDSSDLEGMLQRMGERSITFETEGYDDSPQTRTLDAQGLRAAFKQGAANGLGLDKGLLMPRKEDLKRLSAERYRAGHGVCPEVVFTFARKAKGWVLVHVLRVALGC